MSGVPVRPSVFFFLLPVALAWAGAATALILAGEALVAGTAVAAAAGFLAVARLRASRSARLFLVAAVAERVVEAAVLGAIAWTALPAEGRLAGAAVIALGTSYLAAYMRVRSIALGFRVSEPGLHRTGLALLLVAFGLVAGVVEVALWAVVALSAASLGLEIVGLARQQEGR